MAHKSEVTNRRAVHRRAPRGKARVECRRGRLGLGRNLAVAFTDVSQTGARLIVREAFDPEDEVEVTVVSVGEVKPALLRGTVIRCQPHDEGLHIISIHFERPMTYALWQKLT